MIRYSVSTILLLLASFVIQQFLPTFTGLYDSRVLLVQLAFLCSAVTVGPPTMLLLAFIGGFLWDAQCTIAPHGGDPLIYSHKVEALRFGYSILLFAAMGFLMQGIQPLFHQGKWHVSALLSGVAIMLYLLAELAIITFVRGDAIFTWAMAMQIVYTGLLTMVFSPFVFALLFLISRWCGHSINPDIARRRRRLA
ncbi:MAG: hypothetical protein V4733_00985 [Verrucomicrobiota bacterium]